MDLGDAQAALIVERDRLERDLGRLRAGHGVEPRDSAERLDAGGDAAVQTFVDELDEGMEEDLRASIDEVVAALGRFDVGTYGRCVDCGDAIPDKRLAALPASARCMDCQRASEHR